MASLYKRFEDFNGYKEDISAGNSYRGEYLSGIESFLEKKKAEANKKRDSFDCELVKDIDAYRERLIKRLGFPLCEYKNDSVTHVKQELVTHDGDVDIIRMQIEIMPDFWYYGILFKKGDEKCPFVISQHGGAGTPEITAGMYKREDGCDSANYNDMTRRVLQYNVNVFAPQMLLWNVEEYGVAYNRQHIDGALRLHGGSITALELYALRRMLDYFEVQDYVDEDRIGMVGLSYGGMYTMYATAVDTRIKSAISCSFFCDRFKYSWADWCYKDCGESFLDAEVAMLSYPRRLYIAMGDSDELFELGDTEKEYERIKKQGLDDKITLHPFAGGHEFWPEDDSLIENLINDLK